ncbi:MAG: type II toxin-antitoxin system Phd/YefM family antitoxin [Planctomycetota bacterium]
MIDVSKGIRSLTDFKANTPAFVDDLKKGDHAMVLTINGAAEIAVMSAATLQKVLEKLDLLDSLQAVRRGIDQADRGEGRPAAKVLADLRRAAGMPSKRRA